MTPKCGEGKEKRTNPVPLGGPPQGLGDALTLGWVWPQHGHGHMAPTSAWPSSGQHGLPHGAAQHSTAKH